MGRIPAVMPKRKNGAERDPSPPRVISKGAAVNFIKRMVYLLGQLADSLRRALNLRENGYFIDAFTAGMGGRPEPDDFPEHDV